MNIRGFVAMLFLVAFAYAAANVNAQGTYSARLISPKLGQVLHPGQKFRVEWKSNLPLRDVTSCEAEVWLSLDGGKTFTAWISPWMDPAGPKYFDWTVPNSPTNAAVLDIRFGCEQSYPESYSPQPASTFVIAQQ
jgi:hypothetical protein